MTAPDAAMIFAAGLGTRMGDLTKARPKPLLEVGGQTLLDRAIGLAEQAGTLTIGVNTHYLADQIGDHLADRDIGISHEPELLDTGGGLRAAVPRLFPQRTAPMFTLNPDVLWLGPNPLSTLSQTFDAAHMRALVLLVAPDRAHARNGGGDFGLDAQGHITRGGPWIYGGAQILHPGDLTPIPGPVFSLNRLWDRLIETGDLYGTVYPGHWCDVGTPEALATAQTLIEAQP